MSREKYCLEIAERAKEWLVKSVAEKTTRRDFKIVDTVKVTYVDETEESSTRAGFGKIDIIKNSHAEKKTRIVTCFHCTYTWMLNCWEKDVDTNINVIYDPEDDSFHSDDPALFG